MPRPPRVLGLMSGTSADGVDAAIIELPGCPGLGEGVMLPQPQGEAPRACVVAHHHQPYPDELRVLVLAAGRDELKTSEIAQLHSQLGWFFAQVAAPLAPQCDLIASHGQTVYHIPMLDASRGWHTRATLQLGEAACIVHTTNTPVVSDFRPHDLMAGGQGAPFVPFADWFFFATDTCRRSIHNLGGISNLTYLPSTDASAVIAFDTGPANCLCDEAAELLGLRFDDGGGLAASGHVHQELLNKWLENEYFTQTPAKSTGRERFSRWGLVGASELSPQDLAATGLELAVESIAVAYERFILPHGLDEIVMAGGGVYNTRLMQRLNERLPVPVRTFADLGWDSLGFHAGNREAAAFALLGYCAFQGWPNTLPNATGASRPVIAGKISR
jgi:anhydro-N-acetylmuramic acid kinase